MTINPLQAIGAPKHQARNTAGKPEPGGFSKLLSQIINTFRPGGTSDENAKSPASHELSGIGSAHRTATLEKNLAHNLEKFHAMLEKTLRSSGVDMSQKIQLEWDGFGGVRAQAHRDFSKIEKAFEADPELLSLFHSVAATANYLDNGDSRLKDFELTFDSGEITLRFQ